MTLIKLLLMNATCYKKGPVIMNWIKVAQLSVTVINEVIEIMKENRMEKNSMNINRYITRGINESIPLDLQILLWNMVKERTINLIQITYIFRLQEDENILSITHEQEQPAYKLEYHYINYVKIKTHYLRKSTSYEKMM